MNQAVSFGLLLGGGVLLVSAFSRKSLADVVKGEGPFTASGTGVNLLSVAGVGATIANATATATATGSSPSSSGSPSAQKMLAAAQQAASSHIAYSKQIQSSGLLAGAAPTAQGSCRGSWIKAA